ncbi:MULTISPECIES: hypothetical protein [unclassified Gordonia (in: high G+C Gram-positive bacteria)]|uniref:hypothetical protein n=1 Tax=unclassified Gordonia (in: high G+C Gram-positive bacteria) TaxID=2657482 RepID=UPI001FFF3B11|nr:MULTISPECIES: hypothetical protein [unclassified Gordonia (in: high G+C Gram-positive bacteria)]UQE76775.1 hypothetical protein MYK68_09565 [Gordonia sp. PP30]
MNGGFGDDELEAFYAEIERATAARHAPRRKRERPVNYEPPICPTPEKIAYPSLAAVTGAILALSAGARRPPTLSCYECSCGAWHLTRSRRR